MEVPEIVATFMRQLQNFLRNLSFMGNQVNVCYPT